MNSKTVSSRCYLSLYMAMVLSCFRFSSLLSYHGAGTKLLNHVLDLCAKQNVSDIYLHVHTINEEAINFYKKFGFEVTDKISNYYTNITPPDCFVLTKYITQTKK